MQVPRGKGEKNPISAQRDWFEYKCFFSAWSINERNETKRHLKKHGSSLWQHPLIHNNIWNTSTWTFSGCAIEITGI